MYLHIISHPSKGCLISPVSPQYFSAGSCYQVICISFLPCHLTEHPDQSHSEKDGRILAHRCRLPSILEVGAREGSWIASSLGCTLSLGLGAASKSRMKSGTNKTHIFFYTEFTLVRDKMVRKYSSTSMGTDRPVRRGASYFWML